MKLKRKILSLVMILTLCLGLIFPLQVSAAGRDAIEVRDGKRYVYMSHEKVKSMISEYNNLCFGLGSIAGFIPNPFTIIATGLSVSCCISKCDLENNDKGNGVMCKQIFVPHDGPLGGCVWITVGIYPQ